MSGFSKAYLNSFTNYELQPISKNNFVFNLERVKRLLAELGNPQKQYPIIHVVGTKGKGSTCIFLSSILRQAGLKVGLYTSPHLYDEKERIRILVPRNSPGKKKDTFEGKISSVQLENILRKIKPTIERLRRKKGLGDFTPLENSEVSHRCLSRREAVKGSLTGFTFFEIFTAIAFYFFAEQGVDVVVAEAGLGGRLDATNVGDSKICVFTPISHDHVQLLGSTLRQIAEEKSAVIKPSTQAVFSAPQKKEARFVIEKNARKHKLKIFYVGRDIQYKIISQNILAETFSLKGLCHAWPRLKSPLVGEHQVVNASLAAAVGEYFLKTRDVLSQKAVLQGLAQARWPARFEILRRKPLVVIDSAHNEDSAKRLAETVVKVFPNRKVVILFGASRDKDIKGILKWLKAISQEIILTKANHPRSFDFSKEKIKQFQPNEFLVTNNARDGLEAALKKAKKDDIVLVAGSIFLAGEIRKLCTHRA